MQTMQGRSGLSMLLGRRDPKGTRSARTNSVVFCKLHMAISVKMMRVFIVKS